MSDTSKDLACIVNGHQAPTGDAAYEAIVGRHTVQCGRCTTLLRGSKMWGGMKWIFMWTAIDENGRPLPR